MKNLCCNTGTGTYPRKYHYVGDFFPSFFENDPWWGIFPPQRYDVPNTYTLTLGTPVDADHYVVNDEKVYSIEFRVPGLDKNNIEITLQNNILSVEYKMIEEENNNNRYYFSTKSFTKKFTLPKECDLNAINSEYKDGILKVSVEKFEKLPDEVGIKRIEVK